VSFLDVSLNEATKLCCQSYRNNQYGERLSQFPELKYEEGKENHATHITRMNILYMYLCYWLFITFMHFFFFFLGPVCISSGSTAAFKAYCAFYAFSFGYPNREVFPAFITFRPRRVGWTVCWSRLGVITNNKDNVTLKRLYNLLRESALFFCHVTYCQMCDILWYPNALLKSSVTSRGRQLHYHY
jgi:hypothetical protein